VFESDFASLLTLRIILRLYVYLQTQTSDRTLIVIFRFILIEDNLSLFCQTLF